MIDYRTGNLTINSGDHIVQPSISEKEFRSLPFDKDRRVDRYQVDHIKRRDVRYCFSTLDREGNEFRAHLIFSQNRTDGQPLRISEALFINSRVADLYTDFYERLEKTKEWHDGWMRRFLGGSPLRRYWWGKVESVSDSKAEDSFIVVSYSQRAFQQGGSKQVS